MKSKKTAAMNYLVFKRRIEKAMKIAGHLTAIFGVDSVRKLDKLAVEAHDHYNKKRYKQAEQSLFVLERYANNQRR